MRRTKANFHRYWLIWIVSLCTMLIACGGNGDGTADPNANDGPGQNPDPNDSQPSTPSGCIPENPTGPVLYVATNGSDDPGNDGSAADPYATITTPCGFNPAMRHFM